MIKKISLPVQLSFVLIGVALFGNLIDPTVINVLYSISLVFKECLGFLLPFMVFSFIATGILSFKKNAPLVLGILLASIICSNSIVAFFAYFVGKTLLPLLAVTIDPTALTESKNLVPLFTIKLPSLIKSDMAMLSAVLTGFFLSFVSIPRAEKTIFFLKHSIELIVNKLFIPILPIYILGFLLEINHQGVFIQLFQTYGKTFTLIIILQMIVLFLIYFIAAGFSIRRAIYYIKNAMPSYLTAFGTMSSTATIPVTVQCAEKNTGNTALSAMATPILANIHLLGDAISTPILALVTLFIFQGTSPDPLIYSAFVGYFCINMLAVAGIPGGGIIVMIPILKTILGFDDMMISIITTLYFLQDGLGTAGNVMGDGALMIIVNKILKRLKIS
ncbi:cation:dicarboxylase symporter family transporter [Candidatus Babeliales bacterium]|nr:cation:dicarboxylase symporter family transporter [Candidatus Babeliales bacterium]MBP9844238.1 cation:dicarboxylase symporter family transporter [Candidatus Babeliales bacterium]